MLYDTAEKLRWAKEKTKIKKNIISFYKRSKNRSSKFQKLLKIIYSSLDFLRYNTIKKLYFPTEKSEFIFIIFLPKKQKVRKIDF